MKRAVLLALKLGIVVVFLNFPLNSAFADTVTSINPAWVLLPNSIGQNTGTFALPASNPGPGCGAENSPTCEASGDFLVSSAFTSGLGTYTITDATSEIGGGISDIVVVSNTGPGGTGKIHISSDANLALTGPISSTLLCQEDIQLGCIGTINLTTADGATITANVGADGQATFKPFGFGFDTSDAIQINGATTKTNVPEPSSAMLLLSGLAALSFLSIRRRLPQ